MTNMRYRNFTSLWAAVTLSLLWIFVTVDRVVVGATLEKKDEKFVLRGRRYPLEPLPIIDEIQIERAFTKKTYMRFLMKCVFFQGPCDIIGKWLKPRTFAALNGKCLACTENQQENMERWLLLLVHHNEELFRVAMTKICMDMDIKVPDEEKLLTIPFLTPDDYREYILLNKP